MQLRVFRRTGLARPRQAHPSPRPARAIYGWFTEGFDTPGLKEAKALQEELGIGVILR